MLGSSFSFWITALPANGRAQERLSGLSSGVSRAKVCRSLGSCEKAPNCDTAPNTAWWQISVPKFRSENLTTPTSTLTRYFPKPRPSFWTESGFLGSSLPHRLPTLLRVPNLHLPIISSPSPWGWSFFLRRTVPGYTPGLWTSWMLDWTEFTELEKFPFIVLVKVAVEASLARFFFSFLKTYLC